MTTTTATPRPNADDALYRQELVWQWQIRLFHWAYAASILVLFATGLYIAHPITTPAGEAWTNQTMGLVRMTHFVAAAVFCVAFFWRIWWFWFGNAHARSGFPYVWRPRWWRDLFRQLWDYLRLDFGHAHMGHNALAGLSYTLVPILGGWLMMLTGLAMFGQSNPDGFWDTLLGWVVPLCGGAFRTHMWHHLGAWVFVAFAIVHVYIVLLDGNQYGNGLVSSMISGRKFHRVGERPDDHHEE